MTLVPFHGRDAAPLDDERELAVLERQRFFAEQIAQSAGSAVPRQTDGRFRGSSTSGADVAIALAARDAR